MNKSFYLVTGAVHYENQDKDACYSELNTILVADSASLTLKDVGKAQQGLQMNLIRKLNRTDLKITDVVITNITYLNTCSEKAFYGDVKE